MRVLITGSLGYVAPAFIDQLRQSYPDAELVGLDAGWFAPDLTTNGRAPETRLDAQLYCDVRDVTAGFLTGVTHVVHLAALSNDPMGNRFSSLTDEINFRQSTRLCELAREAGAESFTFASSGSVYGAGGDTPRTENSEVAPLTAYAKSKISTEQAVLPLASDAFAVTCLRFATACGWSPRMRLDLVLNDFVASAVTSGRVEVLSDGTPWRPLIHVKDMARALEWSISSQRLQQGPPAVVTNVGSGAWNYQIKDLAHAVREVIPGVRVTLNEEAPADKRSYRVDFSRWKTLAPDHQPQQTLAGTVQELHANLSNVLRPEESFRDGRLIRLHALRALEAKGLLGEDLRWL